jgi:hypothetical protein
MSREIDWLLEKQNPAIRYRAMTELLGTPNSDLGSISLYKEIWEAKEVRAMLARQNEQGIWEHSEKEYGVHTSLRYLTAFAEYGLCQDTRLDKDVEYAVNFLVEKETADLRHDYSGCSNALVLRALVMLGYHQVTGVSNLIDRYVQTQLFDGGFMCRRLLTKKPNRKGCYRATVAALLLYAESKRRGVTLSNTESLLEYFLRRDVFYTSGDKTKLLLDGKPGWRVIDNFFPAEPMRIGLPLIVSALCILGVGNHPSLDRAWEYLESKKDANGRQVLEGTLTKQPCTFGKVGNENKWVTFYTLLAAKFRAGNHRPTTAST